MASSSLNAEHYPGEIVIHEHPFLREEDVKSAVREAVAARAQREEEKKEAPFDMTVGRNSVILGRGRSGFVVKGTGAFSGWAIKLPIPGRPLTSPDELASEHKFSLLAAKRGIGPRTAPSVRVKVVDQLVIPSTQWEEQITVGPMVCEGSAMESLEEWSSSEHTDGLCLTLASLVCEMNVPSRARDGIKHDDVATRNVMLSASDQSWPVIIDYGMASLIPNVEPIRHPDLRNPDGLRMCPRDERRWEQPDYWDYLSDLRDLATPFHVACMVDGVKRWHVYLAAYTRGICFDFYSWCLLVHKTSSVDMFSPRGYFAEDLDRPTAQTLAQSDKVETGRRRLAEFRLNLSRRARLAN